jgi:hypothetical protein
VPKTFGRHLAFDFRGIGVTVSAAPRPVWRGPTCACPRSACSSSDRAVPKRHRYRPCPRARRSHSRAAAIAAEPEAGRSRTTTAQRCPSARQIPKRAGRRSAASAMP